MNTKEGHLTAKQLIDELSKLNPDSEVVINIKQYNKVYGVAQLPIMSSQTGRGWVDGTYRGATITVFLPERAYIAGLKK